MQAIQTKYLGPTNHRGSRVKAICAAGSVTVSWDYELSSQDNHLFAAYQLDCKLGWDEKGFDRTGWARLKNIATGTLKDGSFVHVLRSVS